MAADTDGAACVQKTCESVMLRLPARTTIVEVSPRDGLQSLPTWIATEVKVKMIERLAAAGFPVIEITSFAHPRVVPNLRDAEEVCERIERRSGTTYRALVPNARGAERAAAAKIDEMLGLITVSATYLRKNQNMTTDEAVDQAIEAFRISDRHGIKFVMAIGMAMWCPYEGLIPEDNVVALVERFRDAGIRHFYLAGSVGVEDPRQVSRLFSRVHDKARDVELGFHVHNLAGYGMANVVAALDAGACWLEGSICGIGGGIAMPSTFGAIGNLATEDIVLMAEDMGVSTGLDPVEVVAAARDVARLLEIAPNSAAVGRGTREELLAWGRRSLA
jgi:hydroxymethylglutaryl-CoA lyase